jgi:hypothetical protein
MRTQEQLLVSMKQNRAERIRLLSLQEKSQLIKLIERLGHFDLVDKDIAWLEEKCNLQMEAK